MPRQRDFPVETLQPLQRLDVIGDAAGDTPPSPPGIGVSEANNKPLSCSNSVMQAEGAGRISLRAVLAEVDQLPSSSQDV